MASEPNEQWLRRVGPAARAANGETRRGNEREAVRLVENIRSALDFPTHELTTDQRDKALVFARDLVTRLTAESDMAALGWTIPADRASAEYRQLMAAWMDDETPRRTR